MEKCECVQWARTSGKVFTKHHRECTLYDPEGDAREIIAGLLDGMRRWARDEDGVHPEACDAYNRAAAFIGEKSLRKG
jgi:hypothetical protein